jgi:hypothetical protein
MDNTDLAYLAGIIDGEGTITIARAPRNNTKHKVPYYIPHMKVCNTDKALIDWIHQNFGGRLNNERKPTDKWSTLYYIRWNCGKARDLLNQLLPYLRIKRLQALIVLECIGRMNRHMSTGVMMPKEETELRELLYSVVTKLNKRGPKADAERLSEEASSVLRVVRQSDLAGNKLQDSGRNVQSA